MNKLGFLLAAVGGVLALGLAHVWINVGFDEFGQRTRETLGLTEVREELVVGFLPVT